MQKLLPILLIAVCIQGCQFPNLMASAGTNSDFCLVAPGPIYWSKADSADTVKQILKYNAIGKAVCHWTPN